MRLEDISPEAIEALLYNEHKAVNAEPVTDTQTSSKKVKTTTPSTRYVTIHTDPSPQKFQQSSPKTNDFKYKCSMCSQTFERSYQLKRHEFVEHSALTVNVNMEEISRPAQVPECTTVHAPVPPPALPPVFPPMSATTVKFDAEAAYANGNTCPMPTIPSVSSGKQVITIKTEQPDETISDQSLLVPLFEVPIGGAAVHVGADTFSLQNVKQEPEEHYYEITELPSAPEYEMAEPPSIKRKRTTGQKSNKKAAEQTSIKKKKTVEQTFDETRSDNGIEETDTALESESETSGETDSAPESVENLETVSARKKNQNKRLGSTKVVQRTKNRVSKKKRIGKQKKMGKYAKAAQKRVTNETSLKSKTTAGPVVPSKITKVEQLAKELPSLTVNLFDIRCKEEKL